MSIIHLVNVVGGEDQDLVGTFAFDAGDVLEYGVGSAEIPVGFARAFHGRNDLDILPKLGRQDVPAVPYVPVEFERLKLC